MRLNQPYNIAIQVPQRITGTEQIAVVVHVTNQLTGQTAPGTHLLNQLDKDSVKATEMVEAAIDEAVKSALLRLSSPDITRVLHTMLHPVLQDREAELMKQLKDKSIKSNEPADELEKKLLRLKEEPTTAAKNEINKLLELIGFPGWDWKGKPLNMLEAKSFQEYLKQMTQKLEKPIDTSIYEDEKA